MGYLEAIGINTHLLLLYIGIFVFFGIYNFVNKRKYKLPPGPIGLPLVGYLPFLGDNPPSKLEKISKKYGDVFSMYLGRSLVIMVTDVLKAKELLCHPSALERPDDLFLLMPGGVGILASNGPEWTEQRRYAIFEMKNLGFGRSHWENLLEIEVREFMDILAKYKGQPVDIGKEFSASISNNVLSLVTGRRLPAGHPKRDIVDKGVEAFEMIYDQSGFISYYPKLFKFLVELGLINVGQKLNDMEIMSKCIREEIEESRQDKDDDSFIQKYSAEIEKNKRLNLGNSFNEANLLGNVQALIMAGSDTTKVSLQWLFLAMAAFPDIQDKVQVEIDTEFEKDRTAGWADRNKLPYCQATMMEGQRWRTLVPLNVARRTTEDIVFDGFDIPKGATIIGVLTSFHNDTRYWKDPDVFRPERFLKDDGKTIIEPEGYFPFSSGKRMCPGKTVGLIEIFHYFVAVLQKFRIMPASETEPPYLEGYPGLTLHAKQQRLRYVLRQ